MFSMKRSIVISVVLSVMFVSAAASAAITSVKVTPATPTTLTNARAYYLAGVPYTFRVQATDPAATGKTYWDYIRVDIHQGATTEQSFTINIGPDTASGLSGVIVDNIVDQSGGVYTNIDYLVTVRFLWTCTAFTAGSNSVIATARIDTGGTGTDTKTFSFGVISQVKIYRFAQSGDASDGRVTPWHGGFNVTGQVVYYDAGRPNDLIADLVPNAEITGIDFRRTKAAVTTSTAIANTGSSNRDFQFIIVPSYFLGLDAIRTNVLGDYTWSVQLTMATGPATEDPVNTLAINCNEVQIDSLTFEKGGGVDSPPYYVRSVNVTGTLIRLQASLRNGALTAMAGNTTFAISDGTNTYNLIIKNGQTADTTLVTPLPTVAAGANVQVNYTVIAISGGYYDSGQNDASRIVRTSDGADSIPYPCRWENHHWPGYGNVPGTPAVPFTTWIPPDTATATTFTVSWQQLTTGATSYDADFSSYRVYFKKHSEDDTHWLMLDKSVVNYSTLGTLTNGKCTVGNSANPLDILTAYDYRISAIDIWGNEVPLANQITGTVATTAYSVEASISDGISKYTNEDFNNRDPAAHPVRDTGIKVTVRIVTAGNMPDKVNVIFAANDSDMPGTWPSGQYGATGASDRIDILPADQKWSIPCLKVTANTWEGVLPSDNPLVKYGTNIRFIVETVRGTEPPVYTDHTPDPSSSTGDFWTDEWRFRVEKKALFIPWPTRVLNNVMTGTMPCCFPAYFVPVDSLVTIKVYDIKGRVVAILSDKMFRPGGQNIKDLGWCGYNKDNKRVGPGLYYIEIKATTVGNKTVIDKTMKVVVAH
jgi:hypothetical protein